MRLNVLIPLAVILVPLALVAACAGNEQGANGGSENEQSASEETTGGSAGEQTTAESGEGEDIVVQAGDTEVRIGQDGIVVRAGGEEIRVGGSTTQESTSARGGGANGGGDSAGEATLDIQGSSGTEFSGTCTVGDEVNEISGQAPESFTYQLDGRRIECEIRKESPGGSLNLVFTADGSRSVQQISGQGGTVRIVYDNGSLSSSTSS